VRVAIGFGLGWIVGTSVVGGLLGALATGLAGLVVWTLSGFAVGAAQWLLIRHRLRVSPIRWIAATAFGSFVIILVHIYLGTLVSKGIGRSEVLVDAVIMAIIGGLALRIPQAAALGDTPIRWPAWCWATAFGALAAWLGDFGLVTFVAGDLPREAGMIALTSGFWAALSLPQAILIGRAMKGATLALP
jgi:hypothetical protein